MKDNKKITELIAGAVKQMPKNLGVKIRSNNQMRYIFRNRKGPAGKHLQFD